MQMDTLNVGEQSPRRGWWHGGQIVIPQQRANCQEMMERLIRVDGNGAAAP